MSSQTLYRKWRSRNFADIVGQKHVTRTLLNALETERLSHAYLFCGPRGVGKTSVARLLAKAVNCETDGKGEPCNNCALCEAITQGRALDIVEVDAASNRGIDEIRDLREKVNFAPNEARFKFYILDEAHMLTNEAANALLKTLEEPPAHVVFVLVTTEPHKLPATIVSRCQRFDFRRIPLKDITDRLSYICEQEGVQMEPLALELLARLATGSLRDAVSLLDQLVAYCGNSISLEDAQGVLGVAGSSVARDLVETLVKGDLAAGIHLLNKAVADGIDLRQFNREIIDHLRGVLLVKVSDDSSALLDFTPEVIEQMRQQSQLVTPDQLVKIVRVFGQADLGLRGPVPAQLPLELALVEAVLVLQNEDAQPESQPESLDAPVRPAATTPPRPFAKGPWQPRSRPGSEPAETPMMPGQRSDDGPRPTGAPIVVEKAEEPDGVAERVDPAATADADSEASQSQALAEPGGSGDISIDELINRWPQIIVAFGNVDKKLQAFLRDAEPGEIREDTIILHFAHSFHKQAVEKNSNIATIEDTISRLLGVRWRVKCVVAGERKRERPKSPVDDPVVREAMARGARIKTVQAEPENQGESNS